MVWYSICDQRIEAALCIYLTVHSYSLAACGTQHKRAHQGKKVRLRSSKIEVRCASACETIIEVRVCVLNTVKFLATQCLNKID